MNKSGLVTSATVPLDVGIAPPPTLLYDTTVRSIPAQAKPGYLQSYVDSIYKTKITRISGDVGTTIPVAGGTWPDIVRNGYNKRQAWNCDETIIFIEYGSLLLDGNTYAVIASTSQRGKPSGEVRWHPTNPQLMYNTSGSVFQTWNVVTGAKVVLHTFTGYTGLTIGGGEGNLSLDGNWVAFTATRTSDAHVVAFAYDISTNTKHPDIDTTVLGPSADGWISPLHNYLVVGWGGNYAIYTPDGTHITTWPENSKPSHADMAVDNNGDEVLVGICKAGPPLPTGIMIKRRLSDGVCTALSTGGWVSHTSCRDTAVTVPWAFGTHQHPSGRTLYDGELTGVLLDGSRVYRLCFHHDTDIDYDSEVHAAASPTGTRVIFASNWGDATGRPVQTYICDLR